MSPSPGEVLLHYEIERKLGEGGMGEVWLAKDTRLERPVALKFLGRKAALEPQARERLAREARAASSLNHANILAIYAVETLDGQDFIAMEYADGKPLDEWVATHSPSFDELLDVAMQIGDGLGAAHGKGIVHRDVKPSNVMVSDSGRAQVMDFGLAKVSTEPQLTQTGSTLGTLAYMAPEQVRGQEIDARSDQFSFGALLYELVDGRSPFARDENTAAVLHAILEEAPRPLARSRPDLPPDLDRVLARALAKDRVERYPDLAAMIDDLRALRERRPVSTPASARALRARLVIPMAAIAATTAWFALGREDEQVAEPTAPAEILAEPEPASQAPDPASPAAAATTEPAPRFGQRLLSTLTGSPHSGTLNSDGSLVAYVNRSRGVDQLFVTGIDDGEPQRLTTGTQSVERPRWQPGGSLILYQHTPSGEGWADGEVLVISALGGTARTLIPEARRANWSHDGAQIVFERGRRIWMADANGDDARVLDGFPPASNPMLGQMPALSPDGTQVVYFRSELGSYGRLWIGSLDGSDQRLLSAELEAARNPNFTPDGRWIVHSSERDGPRLLWRTSTAPGGPHEPQSITTGTGADSEPCLANDGRRILFTNTRTESVLQVWDATHPSSSARVLRSSRTQLLYPSWSPDGTSIAVFGEGRHSTTELHTLDPDGTNLTQVTRTRGKTTVLMPRWSMDGDYLYYFQESDSASGYHRILATGGESELVAPGWRMLTHPFPALTPDGRSLLSAKFSDTSNATFILRDLESGVEKPFPARIFRPDFSETGALIIGEWPPGLMLSVDAETYEQTRLGTGQVACFAGDGETILFLLAEDDRWQLWSMDYSGKNRTMLRELGQMYELSPWMDVSRYGEVVWAEERSSPQELWVLDQQ